MTYRIEPITAARAGDIAGWRHPPPYDTYDLGPNEEPHLLEPHRYRAVVEGDELVGCCCFGEDARVAGGDYSADALDVGWHMRPDLMGHGRGDGFVGAILAFAAAEYGPPMLRVTIATFNGRSRRVADKAGFVEIDRYVTHDGMEFAVLVSMGSGPIVLGGNGA